MLCLSLADEPVGLGASAGPPDCPKWQWKGRMTEADVAGSTKAFEWGMTIVSNLIRAVFENGVFRPVGPVDLPEQSLAEFEPRAIPESEGAEGLDAIYEVLSRRSNGGQRDRTALHEDHQP